MVIFFEWHQTDMDQKGGSSLPMIGEDTGLEALASPLAGYLGKVQKRAASMEHCPWCTSKGLKFPLRSYRINLQESVTLCTNPQCLFPLVSQSLEDVLATLVPVESTIGSKRKNTSAMEKEESMKPACKSLRLSELDSLEPHIISDRLTSRAEHDAVNIVGNGQCGSSRTDGEKVNGYQRDSSAAETTSCDYPQNDNVFLDTEPQNAACADSFAPLTSLALAGHPQSSSDTLLATDDVAPPLTLHNSALASSKVEGDLKQVMIPPEALNRHIVGFSQSCLPNKISPTEINRSTQHDGQTARMGQQSLAAGIPTCRDIQRDITLTPNANPQSKTGDLSSTRIMAASELVPVPNHLFWRNINNLCWLDSMLIALVNFKSLRKYKPKDEPQQSSVWQLMRRYEDVHAAIQVHQQASRDGIIRVPNNVLQKANADLQSLRMAVFDLLQPKLHCKLGQRESPVFALPLLLMMDSWAEPLFQLTCQWEFKCGKCNTTNKKRVMKTLPTFTNILTDWHPLHAVHIAPCNVCCSKNERRTMMLERVPPVFGLHFVEGLPDNDVRNYRFTFMGKHYSVSTVIQYCQKLKHFVTWIGNSDGTWLEYDDLKHPECKTHRKLLVPAEEIHVVFWEVEENKEPPTCSPSSTFTEPCPSVLKNHVNFSPSNNEVLHHSPDHALPFPHNDTDIICALSVSEEGTNVRGTTNGLDTSIGSTTLLDTFEGLNHNDIVTLTLVEIKSDPDLQPLNNNEHTRDSSLPSRKEMLATSPDSSSTVMEAKKSHGLHVNLPTNSSSSETKTGSSSDPTFVTNAKGEQEGGKLVGRQTDKNTALSETVDLSPSAVCESSKIISNNPVSDVAAQGSTSPLETQQASPVSSTDTLPLSASQESPTVQSVPLQNSQWSFLLSKHPLQPVNKQVDRPTAAPLTKVKPPPAHSTPNPVRRQQISGGLFPKPQLKTEESEGLPLKAAEMYHAFGVKSSNTHSALHTSPERLSGKSKPFQPITSNPPKPLINATFVSGTSLPAPGAKGLSELSTKRSSQSSKVPPGLSDTEALRYKLIKKLKAKKKKLAKLNQMLGHQKPASLQPDSTDLTSPNTVTSSTYDGSICEDLLMHLLSPATTASNLSPDSTDFLEMLANGQEEVDPLACGVSAGSSASQVNTCINEPNLENFLDDFISQAVAQRPTEMETEALSALDLFV